MPSLIQKVETMKGARWRVRFPDGFNENGKRKFVTKTFDLKREASQYVHNMAKLREEDLTVNPSKERFGPYLDRWVETRVLMKKIREITAESYTAIINSYVRGPLGDMRLCDLTTRKIQSLYNEMMQRKEISGRTVRYVHSIIHNALEGAVKARDLARNPVHHKLVELPKKEVRTTEMNPLTAEQSIAVIQAAEGALQNQLAEEPKRGQRKRRVIGGGRYAALIALGFHTGMRPSELFGLTWGDVTIGGDEPAVRIKKALTWTGKVEDGTRSFKRTDPKSAAGVRTNSLSPGVADVLRQHQVAQQELIFRIDARKIRNSDFVFTTRAYRPIERHTFVSKVWKKAVKAAADHLYSDDSEAHAKMLCTRLYDMRHSMVSQWLLAGVDIVTVSERVGHAKKSMTLDVYAHLLPGTQRPAAERMGAALGF